MIESIIFVADDKNLESEVDVVQKTVATMSDTNSNKNATDESIVNTELIYKRTNDF